MLNEILIAKSSLKLGTTNYFKTTKIDVESISEFLCDIVDTLYRKNPKFGITEEGISDEQMSNAAGKIVGEITSNVTTYSELLEFDIDNFVESF